LCRVSLGTAYLLCQLSDVYKHSWTEFLIRSIGYIALTAAAGTTGTWVLWSILSERPSLDFLSLSLALGVSWAFLPCIVLFYRDHSIWMLIAMPTATAVTAVSLKRLFAGQNEVVQAVSLSPQPVIVPLFSGISPARTSHWWVIGISIGVQMSVLLWLVGRTRTAGILLSIPSFVIAWQATATDLTAKELHKQKRPVKPWPILLFTVLTTSLALLPRLNSVPVATKLGRLFGAGTPPHKQPVQSGLAATGYVSIVLWPPSTKKTKIVSIPPHMSSLGAWAASKPLVIPFDGAYWYFRFPDTKPNARAHVMHGNPSVLNMHSTGMLPLAMEAHQNFGSFIPLDCCKEIDIAITNADNRPGKIAIGMALTDSDSPNKPSQYLGEQTIVSSEAAHFSLIRAPIQETLRFHIAPGKLRRFNEITVVFLPAKERALGGAKVDVRQFTLIPH
jgi:hypothetical protein